MIELYEQNIQTAYNNISETENQMMQILTYASSYFKFVGAYLIKFKIDTTWVIISCKIISEMLTHSFFFGNCLKHLTKS